MTNTKKIPIGMVMTSIDDLSCGCYTMSENEDSSH